MNIDIKYTINNTKTQTINYFIIYKNEELIIFLCIYIKVIYFVIVYYL